MESGVHVSGVHVGTCGDIHVASATAQDHLGHPSQLFQQLNEHGLIVKPAKCQFSLVAIDFLGSGRFLPTGLHPMQLA